MMMALGEVQCDCARRARIIVEIGVETEIERPSQVVEEVRFDYEKKLRLVQEYCREKAVLLCEKHVERMA
jgi:hypothetical protein